MNNTIKRIIALLMASIMLIPLLYDFRFHERIFHDWVDEFASYADGISIYSETLCGDRLDDTLTKDTLISHISICFDRIQELMVDGSKYCRYEYGLLGNDFITSQIEYRNYLELNHGREDVNSIYESSNVQSVKDEYFRNLGKAAYELGCNLRSMDNKCLLLRKNRKQAADAINQFIDIAFDPDNRH